MNSSNWLDDPLSGDDLPSVPPDVRARMVGRFCAHLAAMRAPRDEPPASAPESRRRSSPSWPPESMPALTQSGVTLRSPVIPAGAFEEERRPAPVAANDVRPKDASVVPAAPPPPAILFTGEISPERRGMPVLPFGPAKPPPPPPKRAPKTAQSRVYGVEPVKTTPVDDDSIARAVAKVLPFAAPPVPLTLRQYASLCAELAFWPWRSGEILQRYRVQGEAARVALDAFWTREGAARPEIRAAFEHDVAHYTAWLRTQGR